MIAANHCDVLIVHLHSSVVGSTFEQSFFSALICLYVVVFFPLMFFFFSLRCSQGFNVFA